MTRLLAVCAALAAAVPASAADAVIAKVSGPVFVRSGAEGTEIPATGGEELLYGDSVRTGPRGIAHVLIGERTAVLVRGDSSFVLQGEPKATTLSFRIGEFLIGLREKLEKGESFRVRTPAAVAAVRGTLFWGKTDADKTTTYAGFGGGVAVTAKGKTVIVSPGLKTEVPFGGVPSDPGSSRMTLDYARNFAIDGDLQGLEALARRPMAAAPPKKP